jgi:acyl-coenzyme A synthetase/AMP-(fatty) acid ligase
MLLNNTSNAGSPIAHALAAAAAAFADKAAVCRGEAAWSYDLLWRKAQDAGRRLAEEVGRGPVLFVAQNTPASLAFLLGAISSGTVPLLADPAWNAHELDGIIGRCGVRAVAWDGTAPGNLAGLGAVSVCEGISLARVDLPESNQAATRLRDDTAFGRFTSGTSGFARCLQFRAEAALAAAASWRQAAELSASDRVLCLATLNNGLAFNTSVLALLLTGGTLAFHPGRLVASSLLRSLAAVQPTVLVAFPFVYEVLVGRKGSARDIPGLRLAVSSAAPLPEGVRDRWREDTGLAVCDYYGLAEVGPCTFNDGARPESVGVPLPGVTFAVTAEDGRELPDGQVGRVRVQTGSMASDYLEAAGPAFADNIDARGYYVTRDLGLLTADGHLVLKGRTGRTVNVAGRKIDPAEVEAALREMPGVAGAVVRGEEAGGRTLLAAYVESATISREAVVAFCVGRLAAYKVPQRVAVVPRLPRSSAGKISLGRIENLIAKEVNE